MPLVDIVEKMVTAMIPAKSGEETLRSVVLDRRLLSTPVIAIDQVRREIIRMTHSAKEAVSHAVEGLVENERKKLEIARKKEDVTDGFQYEITSYLAALSTREISNEVSSELPVLLHTVNDLERVGDHAVNIAEIAERKIEQKITFSDSANAESQEMVDEVYNMFEGIVVALQANDPKQANSVLVSENKLNRMQVDFRRNHVQRMTEGSCSAHAGLIFIDLVDNIEKIGDHLTNIAQSVIGGLQWDGIDGNTLTGEYDAIIPD